MNPATSELRYWRRPLDDIDRRLTTPGGPNGRFHSPPSAQKRKRNELRNADYLDVSPGSSILADSRRPSARILQSSSSSESGRVVDVGEFIRGYGVGSAAVG
jgi:hypothetical protein